jgi:heparanase 1
MKNIQAYVITLTAFLSMSLPTSYLAAQDVRTGSINPAAMPRVGSVDERFQSYNIEMVEVTGGRFWKPYASKADTSSSAKQPSSNQPAGMDPSLYQYRPPINLANPRLRKLAAALGPVYLRVSGTWANTTFFQNSDDPAPATPPKGFKGVLTRNQWKGVVDFSRAANAEIVTSFAISSGTRDAAGAWTPDQAKLWVDYTNSIGGHIAAAEYMNEPNIAEIGGAPQGYDATSYGRDVGIFRAFAKQALPGLIFLGPGSAGESTLMTPSAMHLLTSADLLTATGPVFDAVSYHSYGAVSSRCGIFGASATTTADAALSSEWLARPGQIEEFYGGIRDRFEPGRPLWNTETAQAACGGDRWASTFLDSFRYLNQLGILAKLGVQVNMHNTLAASDYGLLDEVNYAPRPDYWAALLWHRLMSTVVLDTGPTPSPSLHMFAHCLFNQPGGVALLVINASRDASQSLDIRSASERYTLSSESLQDNRVDLNGAELQLTAGDALPELKGIPNRQGALSFAPVSITFLALPKAHNPNCQ